MPRFWLNDPTNLRRGRALSTPAASPIRGYQTGQSGLPAGPAISAVLPFADSRRPRSRSACVTRAHGHKRQSNHSANANCRALNFQTSARVTKARPNDREKEGTGVKNDDHALLKAEVFVEGVTMPAYKTARKRAEDDDCHVEQDGACHCRKHPTPPDSG